MRKIFWWLAALGATWLGLRGQVVQAAADPLFENVTWGAYTPGFILAPPREVWVVKGSKARLAIGYWRVLTVQTPGPEQMTAASVTRLPDENGAVQAPEVASVGSFNQIQLFEVAPTQLGDQHYVLSVKVGGEKPASYQFALTVHVIDALPPGLKLNIAGLQLLDYLPVQAFLLDEAGRKYLTPLAHPARQYLIELLPMVLLPTWVNGKSRLLANERIPFYLGETFLGAVTVLHQLPPTTYVPGQALNLPTLPLLVQPQEPREWRWRLRDQAGAMLAEVKAAASGEQASFAAAAMANARTLALESVSRTFGGDATLAYAGGRLQPVTPTAATAPLPPLFGGTIDLQTLAQQGGYFPAQWDRLTIAVAGGWTLTVAATSDLPVPFYLDLGPAFGAQRVTPGHSAQLSGSGDQNVALAGAALVMPPTLTEKVGLFHVEIQFYLVRGP